MKLGMLIGDPAYRGALRAALQTHFGRMAGGEVDVRIERVDSGRIGDRDAVVLLCQPAINLIAVPGVDENVLAIIRSEFGDHPSLARRILQKAYVWFALSGRGQRMLASYRFVLSRRPRNLESLLIIAGRRRVRIVDGVERRAHVLPLLHQERALSRELAFRTAFSELPSPRIIATIDGGPAFVEEMVVGAPANRLRICAERAARVAEVMNGWRSSRARNTRSTRLGSIVDAVRRTIRSNGVESSDARRVDVWVSEVMRAAGVSETTTLQIVPSHGDFQPGNVLIGQDKVWVIDWETAGFKSTSYDPLCYALGARSGKSLEATAKQYVESGYRTLVPDVAILDPMKDCRSSRRAAVAVFALEDAEHRIAEAQERNGGSRFDVGRALQPLWTIPEVMGRG